MSGVIKINGVTVKFPKSFKVNVQDIDGNTTRNAAGTMIRDRITTKRKIEAEWGPLSDNEISILLNAVKDQFFQVEYPDPLTGGQRTGTFYVGDRSAPAYSFNDKFKKIKWEGLSMNFVEQ